MSVLRIFADDSDPRRCEEHGDFAAIARLAAAAGVRFERWRAEQPLSPEATQAEVLAAYRDAVTRLQRECGFVTADVVAVSPETPNHPELRKKFLEEHTHSEDEARFFVDGSGLFCIHHERAVYAFLCEKGDLINVPAGTRHWFDMGPRPRFRCIRLFSDPRGWVASFTGSDVAGRFPRQGE